jgi:hypothetical protein
MPTIIDRDYVREHSGVVIKTFGLFSYLRALATNSSGLLEQLANAYLSRGIPMPGRIGNSYRLSALIELRVARIYGRLADRFMHKPLIHDFFRELQAEEEEHGRLMILCLYTIKAGEDAAFVPTILDPKLRAVLRELRNLERRAHELGLDEALDLTEKLEKSEINTIFEKLLAQARSPQSDFFVAQLKKVEGHSSAVPKRIRALREKIGEA